MWGERTQVWGERTEVRRDEDDELLGYVEPDGNGRWRSLTVFGGLLAEVGTVDEAVAELESGGLSSLAETWWYRSPADGRWVPAVIMEARPAEVRAQIGSLPDPMRVVTITDPAPDELRLVPPEQEAS
ncbi:MAG: hypothetical protein M3291_03675 [Actinomycetota bacterium]|nr:hypothetical protein [Actinomycetota bacterium]